MCLFISDWVAMEPEEQPGRAWMYIALTGGLVLAQTLSWIALMGLLLTLSLRLHDRMLERVTRAPTLFFDANPLGRIINRFSKDTAATDSSLPNLAAMFINMLWYVLVMVGLSLSVFPELIPLVIILLAIHLIAALYVKYAFPFRSTSRENARVK